MKLSHSGLSRYNGINEKGLSRKKSELTNIDVVTITYRIVNELFLGLTWLVSSIVQIRSGRAMPRPSIRHSRHQDCLGTQLVAIGYV